MLRKLSFLTSILLLIACFFLVNILCLYTLNNINLDLTREQLYSLSNGTKNILKNLDEPITIKYYFSRTDSASIPYFTTYANRVKNLLSEYKRFSGGKIKLEVFDPRPDSEEAEWANRYGLKQIPLQVDMPIYFGLVGINTDGDEETIAFFDQTREEFLEYDITKLIYNLTNPQKTTVGIMTSLLLEPPPFMQDQKKPEWSFIQYLRENHEIVMVPLASDKINDDIDILLIVHPKDIKDKALFAIDQFILKGKPACIFIDPFCLSDAPDADPNNPSAVVMANRTSDLGPLPSAWGIKYNKSNLVADLNCAASVASRGQRELYILWLNLLKDNLDSNDVITGELESLLFVDTGYFDYEEEEGITIIPLVFSSSEAQAVGVDKARFQTHPATLLREYSPGSKILNLALRLNGNLKTAYPDGLPKDESENIGKDGENDAQDETSDPDDLIKESIKPANIVIVADVDLLCDNFSIAKQNFFGHEIVTSINDNFNFLFNSLENLGGSNDLISIRSRGSFRKPFTKVLEIEKRAQEKWQDEEKQLTEHLNETNEKLKSFANRTDDEKMLNKAVVTEINKFKDEKFRVQKQLKNVRKNLREEKERLGVLLFLANTFLVPIVLALLIIIIILISHRFNRKKT